MKITYEHKKALQKLVDDYYRRWILYSDTELPNWFYVALDFMEVQCGKRFNVVTGTWEEA